MMEKRRTKNSNSKSRKGEGGGGSSARYLLSFPVVVEFHDDGVHRLRRLWLCRAWLDVEDANELVCLFQSSKEEQKYASTLHLIEQGRAK